MSTTTQDKFRTREEFINHLSNVLNRFFLECKERKSYVSFKYLRGKATPSGSLDQDGYPLMGRGAPEGVLFSWEDYNGNLVYGWSARHPTKENKTFSKKEGIYRAWSKAYYSGDELIQVIPLRYMKDTAIFIIKSKEFYDRWVDKRNSGVGRADD